MSVQVPIIRCSLLLELYNARNQVTKKENFKLVDVSLARNEFKEIMLEITFLGKETKKKTIPLKYNSLNLFRKFVKEGKLTISFTGDSPAKVFLSNAPPNELVIFAKTLAAKMAGTKDKPKVSTRTKLLSDMGNSTEGISPVTAKDIVNLRRAEAGGNGLLKQRGYTPNIQSPLLRKRKRIEEKENDLCGSPILTGSTQNSRTQNLESANSPNRGGGEANILARSTPTRQTRMLARRPLRAEPAAVMTQEQRWVVECVKSGKNVFITGGAGTGKSFLIHKIIGVLPPDHTYVTASTGVAAFQIGGTTLHSFAGIGSGAAEISTCVQLAQRKTVSAQWRKCKHLIIDEVSMVEGNYFKKLEHVARSVKNNDKPFGGIQLIMVGDFFQLPPVVKKGDKERRFAFETSAWTRCVQLNIELTQVKRQSDARLVEVLTRLRRGHCSMEDAELLAETRTHNVARNGIVPTKLFTHTDDVSTLNKKELAKCEGEERKYDKHNILPLKCLISLFRFTAYDSDPALSKFLDNHTSVESLLTLKVGAQVMLLKNLNVSQAE